MLFAALFFVLFVSVNGDYRRVCYYTNWSQYRPLPQGFFPEDINVFLCTHYVFYFAKLEDNQVAIQEWNDELMYERFNSHIHSNNPSAKTLLSVYDSGSFTSMLASAENRLEFINSSIEYLRARDFDGLDLALHYPGSNESPPGDKLRFTLLCQEARAAFEKEANVTGRDTLLLTSAVPATQPYIDNGYDIDLISAELDYVSIKSFDFHGTWESNVEHHSPLYSRSDEQGSDAELNQNWAANYWFQGGCPKEKIVVGMAGFGRCFVLEDPSQNEIGSPAIGACPYGEYTRLYGLLAYYEICPSLDAGTATEVWHEEHEVTYAYLDSSWTGYDSAESLRGKIRWLKEEEYSGFMFWALDLDDFNGEQCDNVGPYPLLYAMVDELYGGLNITTMSPPVETTLPAIKCGWPTSCQRDGYYPHPNHCDGFYQCSNDNIYYNECTIDGTIYDPFAVACEYINSVNLNYICCKCPDMGADHKDGPCDITY